MGVVWVVRFLLPVVLVGGVGWVVFGVRSALGSLRSSVRGSVLGVDPAGSGLVSVLGSLGFVRVVVSGSVLGSVLGLCGRSGVWGSGLVFRSGGRVGRVGRLGRGLVSEVSRADLAGFDVVLVSVSLRQGVGVVPMSFVVLDGRGVGGVGVFSAVRGFVGGLVFEGLSSVEEDFVGLRLGGLSGWSVVSDGSVVVGFCDGWLSGVGLEELGGVVSVLVDCAGFVGR